LPYYVFTIVKNGISLELDSADPAFVKSQMDKCLEEATGHSFTDKKKTKPSVKKTRTKEIQADAEEIKPVEKKVKKIEPVKPEIEETDSVEISLESREKTAVKDDNQDEPKLDKELPIETIVNTVKAASEEVLETVEEKPADPFQQIFKEKITELPETVNTNLDKKLAKPIKAEEKAISSLDQLIDKKNPRNLLEYLMITAYFLKSKEQQSSYSLKHINSKVMPFAKKLVDHSVIQEAVAKNLIEVVPDYTGTAEVTEYAITSDGEKFVTEL
jgi:copper chaperone CopZ